ncbi:protein kinase domain-containing protein [Streptomyces sp. BE230]|uniref:protein kinase domain-containing protein n=1 Tax=Streptomyces sp. BE230 TaxID=3002526 RepID=UPI002ED20D49|nr:protein kinase [Streptomyces sp. BE230]
MNSASHHIGPDAAPDRYRLLNSIGRGGEAVLYRAEIELDGAPETVVVKVLDSKTTITIEQFHRLSAKWREQAELLRFVNRPGVVGVREHFEGPPIHGAGDASTAAGRALVLVMNHVDGLDLRDWRAERTLSSHAERREVLRTLEQLADVLDWLHSGRATPSGRTVVHGDLSPGNVMVDAHGQATLVDFGLSKLTADHQTAEVWFTPGYAAPEVFDGKRTPNTDRYAFGAIAYFLLSGQAPPSTPEQLRAALRALPQVAAATPERCERILSVCAAEPDGRPESLSAWVKDVRSAVVSTTVTGSSARDAVRGPAAGGESVRDTPPAVTPALVPPPPLLPPPGGFVAAPPPAPSTPPPVAADSSQSAFPPPITASSDPGVSLPSTVNPDTATAAFASAGLSPEPDLPRQTLHTPPPAQKKKRRMVKIALPVVAAMVCAGLGAWGVLALQDNNDQGNKGSGASSTRTSLTPTPSATEQETPDAPADTPVAEPGTEDDDLSSTSPEASTPGSVEDVSQVSLTTMSTVAEPQSFSVGSAKLNTQVHNDAFVATPECDTKPYMEFDLGRAWTTFELTAGVDDGSNYESGRLTIKVDDTTLWVGTLELGKPQKLSLKVKNALRLRIGIDENCDGANLALGTPMLKR